MLLERDFVWPLYDRHGRLWGQQLLLDRTTIVGITHHDLLSAAKMCVLDILRANLLQKRALFTIYIIARLLIEWALAMDHPWRQTPTHRHIR